MATLTSTVASNVALPQFAVLGLEGLHPHIFVGCLESFEQQLNALDY